MAIKVPLSPVPWKQLKEKYGAQRFKDLFNISLAGPTIPGKYLHWEDFRHRKPPEGLTVEEAWFVEKIWRVMHAKTLPLLAFPDVHFWFVLTDDIQDRLRLFDEEMGRLSVARESADSLANRKDYLVATLLEEAYTSSVLEGAVATREQAKEMVRTGRVPRDRSERMILNNFQAMQQLQTWKDEPLSLDLLLRMHRMITENTLDRPGAGGRFRRADEDIKVMDEIDGTIYYVPPSAAALPGRVEQLINLANQQAPNYYLHPLLRAILLHFQLAYDHPFVDGNGRTARTLFYWSMLRSGYLQFEHLSISHVIYDSAVQYAKAYLHVETDENDATYFLHYHLEKIELALRRLGKYVQRKRAELEEVESKLRHTADFNHRQQALLVHALKHPHFRYTIQGHQRSHGVVYQTARADLLALAHAGLLRQGKAGRIFHFTPIPALGSKLSSGVSAP